MAALKLETENVRRCLMEILNNLDVYGVEGKEAEHLLHYIAGAHDMANKVIETIEELGGK